jgi:signal transduction histidine kinase
MALQKLSRRTKEFHRLSCDFECEEPVAVNDPALATQLYLIAQEAVHNAVRHAQASRIIIRLVEDCDTLRLQVSDDGVGISPERDGNSGIGIPSMAYRAGLIGAHLRIDGVEEGGTAVTCVAPKRRSGRIRREL